MKMYFFKRKNLQENPQKKTKKRKCFANFSIALCKNIAAPLLCVNVSNSCVTSITNCQKDRQTHFIK